MKADAVVADRPAVDWPGGRQAAREEILAGLQERPRSIPSKYFYDAEGSRLFEEITRLEEYYLTRAEKEILRQRAGQLLPPAGRCELVELGSGDCSKISILVEAGVRRGLVLRYVPVDVSPAAIRASCADLSRRFPGVELAPRVADFEHFVEELGRSGATRDGARRMVCFFGSTLGNLTRQEARAFVARVARALAAGDSFLVGLDLVKDRAALERAYNDSAGVTAAFNRNILHVANALAGTNFEPERFEHRATYNEEERRIEMELVARQAMVVTAPGLAEPIRLEVGEAIHTEYSHKFTDEEAAELAASAGLALLGLHFSSDRAFALAHCLQPGPAASG